MADTTIDASAFVEKIGGVVYGARVEQVAGKVIIATVLDNGVALDMKIDKRDVEFDAQGFKQKAIAELRSKLDHGNYRPDGAINGGDLDRYSEAFSTKK